MKRVIVWVIVLGLLSGGGFFAWRYQKAHAPPAYTFQT